MKSFANRSTPCRFISQYRLKVRIGGFTYLSLLILVAVIAVAASTTLQLGSIVSRRAAEEELLAIGAEFQAALNSYANATPQGQKRSPASLEDLLKDPRYPGALRHLRKLYADPMTGKAEWGTIELDGGIVGVYSLSTAKPIKIKNFDTQFTDFEEKSSYQDWKFMAAFMQSTAPNITLSAGNQASPKDPLAK